MSDLQAPSSHYLQVVGPTRENQRSIYEWAAVTFRADTATPARLALRMLEEAVELCRVAGATPREITMTAENGRLHDQRAFEPVPDFPAVPGEAADVLVTLYNLAGRMGFDLHAETDTKMQRNRDRAWRLNGDGTAQHSAEPDQDH